MIDRTALIRIAKSVAADMASGKLKPATELALHTLEDEPRHVLDLVDLMAKEGARKRPSDKLIGGYSFLLAHGLELLRFAVERKDVAAMALADRLRRHLLEAGASGRISPPILMLVLHQFVSAKLEIGDDLRAAMQALMENDDEVRAAADDQDGNYLARMAEQLGGDPFALQACLDETVGALPEDARPTIIAAVLGDQEAAVRESAVGFLLDASAEVRQWLAAMLELASAHGAMSPSMLRRMIAMRGWLPAADRAALDKAIDAARQAGIECAPWPRPKVRQVLASGVDGSGALTVLSISEEAGQASFAGLLIKQGFGVRDAWVRRNASAEELAEIVEHVIGEIRVEATSVDYAAMVTRRALAMNLDTGHQPPFGVLAVAEAMGLAELNPQAQPLDALVADLCSAIDPARLEPDAVAATLQQSADWADEHAELATWFEENVTRSIGTKPAPRAKRMAALLAGPLKARRGRWAELAAWTALSLRHRNVPGDWQGFAIVARELLGKRPLDEIGLMRRVADTTLDVMGMLVLRGGARDAA